MKVAHPHAFDGIVIKGAREHNLKNISLAIPRNKITVLTGLSGSGKSSLAFDTIYAEGQRRYVESLSAYARNFLDQLKKPDVDSITGLSPAIAIEQKTSSTNPRSTVGTVTGVFDYLRLLYARVGVPRCPTHHIPLQSQSQDQIAVDLMSLQKGARIHILAPIVRSRKGEFLSEFQNWTKKGFLRARVDGKYIELQNATKLTKTKTHTIELLIDRLEIKGELTPRLSEAIHLAVRMADGFVTVENQDTKSDRLYSVNSVCHLCQFSFPEMEPRLFSFNNPKGACPSCDGLGYEPSSASRIESSENEENDDDEAVQTIDELALKPCQTCMGYRLRREALSVFIDDMHIGQMGQFPIHRLATFFKEKTWSARDQLICHKVIKQLEERLNYLSSLGVGYLSLYRSSRTLSGGESQRIRLATQLGSSLVGVLYVLDEPSIGLHPKDHRRLLDNLEKLRDLGNTVVLVEHDEETIRAADHVIDLGPRAGILGGEIVAEGTPLEIEKHPKSLTGLYLSGHRQSVDHRARFKEPENHRWLEITGAKGNNLKDVSLKIPLETFTVVTGVSGSGKSTLVIDTLFRAVSNHFYNSNYTTAPFDSISGLTLIDRIVNVDQKPIGRTPRSNPATYVGLFSQIRDLFSQIPDSKVRGYKPGRFSFNVKGGRCEACQGGGMIRVEMHFLADVYVQCDVCQGRRYNQETLTVKYRGKSISDILAMSVDEASAFFEHHKIVSRKVNTLQQVGLEYITLGQSSTSLSGGEAQRIKLSRELSKRSSFKTLYILDEPTTGLHFEDVKKLIELLHQLVDQGNTVLVIEHNIDVILSSDYVIDLGPEGGENGGRILATGTPEDIKSNPNSVTGPHL